MAGKTSRIAVWIILGLLIVGLAGFGATGLSGTARSIGSVGDKDIGVTAYANALQQELRALQAQTGTPVSFAQAQAFGIDQAVLARLVTARALDHETATLGLSVGDEQVRRQLLEIPAFQSLDGQFDREAYRFALQQSGLNEAEFEAQVRDETARSLLQGAVTAGLTVPDSYTDTLLAYLGERRNFAWARLGQNDLPEPVPAPTEADLTTYYQGNPGAFTLPERKKITYAVLTPNMILDSVEVDEEALRARYQERINDFVRPERRLVERLVFGTAEDAAAAKARLDGGEVTFDALVAERGLGLGDVDLGDVTRADLGTAADAVFAVTAPGVVGPAETDLGPALFRMNAILQAQETSFEEAEPELRDELAADRARRVIVDSVSSIDDLLAGGATLEEVVAETDMILGTMDWYEDVAEGIAGYAAFRDAATALSADDFPEVIELEDDGIVAMRLDEVLAPTLQPLADVREDVIDAWEVAELEARLRGMAEELVPQLGEGKSFAALGVDATLEEDITRRDFITGTPPDFLLTVFSMSPGDVEIVEAFGSVLVVRLDRIQPPDDADEDLAAIRMAITEQAQGGIAQDVFTAFATRVQSRAGIELNRNAINAVNAQFQ